MKAVLFSRHSLFYVWESTIRKFDKMGENLPSPFTFSKKLLMLLDYHGEGW